MSKLAWWQRGVVYQIYPRSFQDTSGNGVGDLQGVIERLAYLNDGTERSLGVDAIWLSPFYPSPMKDFGYDVSDYCNVHPLFGDLATFDRLIEEAHKRGIRIIIDYVPNHTSDEHPWFIESRSSRDNPKADWYIWRDPKPDGSPPNNWGSVFGGPAWEWDETRQQYYFHQFVVGQPDLNWRNPEVKAAMFDVLRFWLERGVDGFRMDVIGMIIKHPDMPDQPWLTDVDPNLPENAIYWRQEHIYDQDQDDVHQVLREMRALLDEYGDTVGIGELFYSLPRWVKYYGEQGDELHLPFNFRLIDHLPVWDAQQARRIVDDVDGAVPPFGWPNYVLGNHDQPRVASRFGAEQARTAAMLLLTLRGTPTLYYGDELGIPNGDIKPEQKVDPWGIQMGVKYTRDVCRTPMQWDDSPYAGFSNVEPWLPVTPDYRTRNVAAQDKDERSMLNLYRRLLWYRKGSAPLYGGSYQAVDTPHADVFAYLREADGERIFVALNFGDEERTVSPPSRGQLVLSTALDRAQGVTNEVKLRPYEGVIIELG